MDKEQIKDRIGQFPEGQLFKVTLGAGRKSTVVGYFRTHPNESLAEDNVWRFGEANTPTDVTESPLVGEYITSIEPTQFNFTPH
jgi:hypothetical protein